MDGRGVDGWVVLGLVGTGARAVGRLASSALMITLAFGSGRGVWEKRAWWEGRAGHLRLPGCVGSEVSARECGRAVAV